MFVDVVRVASQVAGKLPETLMHRICKDIPVSNQWHIVQVIRPVHLIPSQLNFIHIVKICHSHTQTFSFALLTVTFSKSS